MAVILCLTLGLNKPLNFTKILPGCQAGGPGGHGRACVDLADLASLADLVNLANLGSPGESKATH